MTGCIGNGQGVSSGFSGRKIKATAMRRPDRADGRVKGDGPGIRHVVAKLGLFAAMHDGGRDVQGTNGQLGTAELFDSGTVVGALLLGGFLGVALFQGAIRFMAGKEDKADIEGYGQKENGGIKIRIFERRFLRGLGIRICG
jgi:hypothetical protein